MDEISLAELWQIISAGKWVIIAVTLFTTAIVTAASFIMTPIYQAEVLLAPRGDDDFRGGLGELGDLAALAGVRLDSGGDKRTQAIAMLRSRSLAKQFIDQHDLIKVMFDELWDAEAQRWLVEESAEAPTMRKGVRKFIGDVRSVDEDADTGLVTLVIRWKDPLLVEEWANGFVELLNAEMRQQAIAESEESIEYLQKEADKTSVVELDRVIYSLVEEQIQTIMLANVREEYAFEILDPAIVPEPDERVWPKRSLMIVVGFVFGLLLGMFGILVRNVRRQFKAAG